MIEVVDVWHHYSIRPVLKHVSLKVERGEVVVLMGPNGMGKSTLLSVVAGLIGPIKGEVVIDGIRRRSSVENEIAIRKKLIYLPDTPWFPMRNSPREYIQAVGRIYGVEEERLMDHVESLLDLFDLASHGDSPISSCSTGQRKKVGLCAALVAEAEIMVLDEPFSGGLDSSALLALSSILKNFAARDDRTILLSVPVPELIEGLADRIAIIKDGHIIAFESPSGLRKVAGFDGPLPEVIERIVHPERVGMVHRYMEGKTDVS